MLQTSSRLMLTGPADGFLFSDVNQMETLPSLKAEEVPFMQSERSEEVN